MPKYFYKIISIAIILITFAILYSFVWRPFQKNRNFEKCLNNSKTNFENKTNEINSKISELENKKNEITPEIDEKFKNADEKVSELVREESKFELKYHTECNQYKLKFLILQCYKDFNLQKQQEEEITNILNEKSKQAEIRNNARKPIEDIEKDIENLKKEIENLKEVKKESDNECYKRF